MPAIHKVIFYFNGRKHGWTETLFMNSTDAVHETTMKKARALAIVRAPLLGAECSIDAISVSTDGSGPDSMLRYFDQYVGNPQQKAADQDLAVLVRCEGPDHKKWKNIFLRGFWDAVESEHGKYLRNTAEWREHMQKYIRALEGDNGWGWMTSTRSLPVKLSNVVMDNDDCTTFTAAENVWIADDVGKKVRVRISGVNGKSTANGMHVVEVKTVNSAKTVEPLAVGAYRFGGRLSTYGYAHHAIASATDEKVVTRKSGSPLLESRGRSKARPRA